MRTNHHTNLYKQLVRLAQTHPEFRKDLLPLVRACDHTEGLMMGKYEEGKPADPTENMSPEDKKEWELNTLKYRDKFKQAEAVLCSNLVRLAHAHPEYRKELIPLIKQHVATSYGSTPISKRSAITRAVVRKTLQFIVSITSTETLAHREGSDQSLIVMGRIAIDFGGDITPESVKFTAIVLNTPKGYIVDTFTPQKTVSGGSAVVLINILKAALQEVLDAKGDQLLT